MAAVIKNRNFSNCLLEDLNVKVYDVRWMPSDGKSSHGLWPGELTNATNLCLVDSIKIH
jgi:hypothetical protein